MITMPLTVPEFSKSKAPANARARSQPACFQPLDPYILSRSFPTFFVGRNHDGFWLARDIKGEKGGIFLFKASALAFARRISRPLPCAIILLSERFELDVENKGNPLIGYLKPMLRFVTAGRECATDSAA